jgi:ubiquinone/menaquinone biosynthesis C-methylase UbiE
MGYEFAQLEGRREDWMLRQYVMRARFAEECARDATRVLDIASGSGYLTYHLARTVPQSRVTGVDVSAAAVAYAAQLYQADNLAFATGDGFALQFPDGHFDMVVTFETIEHVPDGDRFVKELARVTDPQGTLLLSTPYKGYDFPDPTHINTYDASDLFALLRKHFDEVGEFYQHLGDDDRADAVRSIAQGAREARSWRSRMRRLLASGVPRPLKHPLKRCLGMASPPPRRFLIRADQYYPAEEVTAENRKAGATPFILLAVCRRPKRTRG